MIDNTKNKNSFARPSARLQSPEVKAALLISEVLKKPFVKSRGQAFAGISKVKNPSANKVLNSLNAGDFLRLQPHLEPVSLVQGESLYQPEDRIRYVYFPESAVISNLQMLEDGRTIEIAMTGREGVTGLPSVFSSQTAANWTEVAAAGKAFKLSAEIFRQEFNCGNSLQISLLNYVNFYIQQISQKIICNNFHQVKERFCSWLLTLEKCSGRSKFFLTHEQMARFLGVHRPGVSNLAKELRERGAIDCRRGQIIILDDAELARLTCSCFH